MLFSGCLTKIRDYYNTVLKKEIHLPPNLFEDIQLMGRQIGWPISSRFLKPCLGSRDALNWVNLDLLLGHYETKDLLRVQESHLPLKQFSFRVYRLSADLICLIQKFAQTLEILHVGYHQSKSEETLVR